MILQLIRSYPLSVGWLIVGCYIALIVEAVT